MLTPAQQRVWYVDQLAGNTVYSVPTRLRFASHPDHDALVNALGRLVERHEALRTRCVLVDGEPRIQVLPPAPVTLPVSTPTDASATVARPFDLACEPPARFTFTESGSTHELHATFHHLAVDVVSLSGLFDDLAALYREVRDGTPAPPPVPSLVPQPPRHHDPHLVEYAAYLAEARRRTPPLPTDRPRPRLPRFEGDSQRADLDRELGAGVTRLAADARVTPNVVLLAAAARELARRTNSTTALLGVPSVDHGRTSGAPAIGCFVNLLPVVVRVDPHQTGIELVHEARDALVDALEFQAVDFGELIHLLPADLRADARPLTRVVFSYDHGRKVFDLGEDGTAELTIDRPVGTAKFELTLSAHVQDGSYGLELEYDTELFDPTTGRSILEGFGTALAALTAHPRLTLAAPEPAEGPL